MPKFLYTVEDIFDITGLGLVAVPGIPWDVEGIRRGTALQLRRPDGTILRCHIHSILLPYPNVPPSPIQFSLPPGITKSDLPVGTQVWLDDVPDSD